MPLRKSSGAHSSASNGHPHISGVFPAAAIPGGDFQIRGEALSPRDALGGAERPRVRFGKTPAQIVVGSDDYVVARVPAGAVNGELSVGADPENSVTWPCQVGVRIAEGLHPVSNPVVDHSGNIFVTFSGAAGQKTPVSIFKIDATLTSKPLVTDLMNATGLALDKEETLYVSSRSDGVVYQVSAAGNTSPYVEGMGVATGMVFDQEGNLFVGDRSGTIFKISRQRQIYVFATLEPSIAAYHLAFGPDDYLYVTGPTTSSFDSVARISRDGHVERFYRGLGRPQGLAFDVKGNLYVAASIAGRRGIVRISPEADAELFLSGPSIVGMAFTPSKSLLVATNETWPSRGPDGSLYRVNLGIEGRPIH
ncbi:MAG TPA: IPT/TIG domain-containing protein [Bryobacteraceae bacterium]|jgi:sugar lactone lactonase YvrE